MGYPYSAQPVLVSGANIKTIGGESVLGSGDIDAVTSADVNAAIEPVSESVALLANYPLQQQDFTIVTDVVTIGSINGIKFGRGVGSDFSVLYEWNPNTSAWVALETFAAGVVSSIHLMGNGEVIVSLSSQVWRSTGWATSRSTATWTKCFDTTSGASAIPMCMAVKGSRCLIAEYAVPRGPSQKLRLSLDYGVTWSETLNLKVYEPGDPSLTHWHGTAIDEFASPIRLWASYGDGPRNLLYSDNDGATWNVAGAVQPTVMEATRHGLLLVTDYTPDGVFLLPRGSNSTADLIQLYKIQSTVSYSSLVGFGVGKTTDTDGTVYLTFRQDETSVPSLLLASDGLRVDLIAEGPAEANLERAFGNPAILADRIEFGTFGGSGYGNVTGNRVAKGSPYQPGLQGKFSGEETTRHALAMGNIAVAAGTSTIIGHNSSGTGQELLIVGFNNSTAAFNTGIAIGLDNVITGEYGIAIGVRGSSAAETAIAIGRDTDALGVQSICIGYIADCDSNASNGICIGTNAQNKANQCIVIGAAALAGNANAINAIIIGSSAFSWSVAGIAIGQSATNAAEAGICIGRSTRNDGLRAVALGDSANAPNDDAVALGSSTTTTATFQVQFGARHFERSILASDPAAPATDRARDYFRKNGLGKLEYCVRFPTGAVQVIATEP